MSIKVEIYDVYVVKVGREVESSSLSFGRYDEDDNKFVKLISNLEHQSLDFLFSKSPQLGVPKLSSVSNAKTSSIRLSFPNNGYFDSESDSVFVTLGLSKYNDDAIVLGSFINLESIPSSLSLSVCEDMLCLNFV